jgi:hypothetical protein
MSAVSCPANENSNQITHVSDYPAMCSFAPKLLVPTHDTHERITILELPPSAEKAYITNPDLMKHLFRNYPGLMVIARDVVPIWECPRPHPPKLSLKQGLLCLQGTL